MPLPAPSAFPLPFSRPPGLPEVERSHLVQRGPREPFQGLLFGQCGDFYVSAYHLIGEEIPSEHRDEAEQLDLEFTALLVMFHL